MNIIESWSRQQASIEARKDELVDRLINWVFVFVATLLIADFLIRLY